jgi:hypothetical protein
VEDAVEVVVVDEVLKVSLDGVGCWRPVCGGL